jgi:CBS domain-containing protein
MMKEQPRFVGEIMSKDVVTLEEDATLENLDESMRTLRFRHMPVVDGKRLIGLISQRDVLRVSASTLLPAGHKQTEFLTKKFAVRDVMTRDVQTVRAETPLGDAARLMLRGKVGCLPVIDAENKLVGILTEADFVKLSAALFPK